MDIICAKSKTGSCCCTSKSKKNGREIGKFLLERHSIVESFLRHIGAEENILLETELIEHNITARTLEKIDIFNKFLETFPELIQKLNDFKKP